MSDPALRDAQQLPGDITHCISLDDIHDTEPMWPHKHEAKPPRAWSNLSDSQDQATLLELSRLPPEPERRLQTFHTPIALSLGSLSPTSGQDDASSLVMRSRQQLTTAPPYLCSFRGCGRAYQHKAELDRHTQEKHGPTSGRLLCPIDMCARGIPGEGFDRMSHLAQHLQSAKHGMTSVQAKVMAKEYNCRKGKPADLLSSPRVLKQIDHVLEPISMSAKLAGDSPGKCPYDFPFFSTIELPEDLLKGFCKHIHNIAFSKLLASYNARQYSTFDNLHTHGNNDCSKPLLSQQSVPNDRKSRRPTSATCRKRALEGNVSDDGAVGPQALVGPKSPRKKSKNIAFACHFHKLNPEKFSIGKYKSCKHPFNGMHRLKEHHKRVHRPLYYCSCCKKIFKSRDEMDAHIGNRSCTKRDDPDFSDYLTSDKQRAVLKKRSASRGLAEDDHWYEIWDAFFEGHVRPSSPYLDGARFHIAPFVYFAESQGPSIVEDFLASRPWERNDGATRRMLEEFWQEAFRHILDDYHTSQLPQPPPEPSLKQESKSAEPETDETQTFPTSMPESYPSVSSETSTDGQDSILSSQTSELPAAALKLATTSTGPSFRTPNTSQYPQQYGFGMSEVYAFRNAANHQFGQNWMSPNDDYNLMHALCDHAQNICTVAQWQPRPFSYGA